MNSLLEKINQQANEIKALKKSIEIYRQSLADTRQNLEDTKAHIENYKRVNVAKFKEKNILLEQIEELQNQLKK